ncbi:poly-beta-1,6 N-acetyl-D-glucosamine export porin PgaA [Crenothrix polyspora]|uniref:Tetratricopeptide TPR_2 repeat-containing protein n=1 Tax=Crenothrix polyspora TaxID=360316 RepID=A0A1R4H569_9GAMM
MKRLRASASKSVKKILLLSMCLHVPAALSEMASDAQYQQAIQIARTGDTAQALKLLEHILQNNPGIQRYRYDYIQILSWENRDSEVLKQEAVININTAPIFVLEAVAKSARNTKDFHHAEVLYRRAMAADPARLDPQLGLAWVMIDQQQADSAIPLLTNLAQTYPQNIDILMALASAYEVKKQYLTSIMLYENILSLQPDHTGALRGQIFALTATGAIPLAYEKAQANKGLFSDDEWAHFHWDAAATLIRWGEATPFEEKQRFDETDIAIKAVEDNIALIKTLKLKEPEVWLRRARIDLIIALRYRYRMQDVIKQYDILQQQKIAIPAYGRAPVADAYLYLEEPEKARDIYLSIIKELPQDFSARSALVYAYLETEQFDEAVKLAAQLAKEQPAKLRFKPANAAEYTKGNPKKTSTELTLADMSAYADKLDDAVDKLEALYNRASFNTDIRHDLARAYYFRGWPRRAEKHFDMALNIAPKHLGLKVGHAEIMRELQSYRKAEKETLTLFRDYPEDKGVQKQKQLWDIHNDWQFKSSNNGGISTNPKSDTNNNPRGSEDISTENYLYTPPIDYNFRIFAHQGWSTGLFPMQSIQRPAQPGQARPPLEPQPDLRAYLRTYGLGLEYSARNLIATSEIHYDNFSQDHAHVGINGAVSYEFNDRWQLSAGFDSLDNNISLRALSAGTTATSGKLGVTYRVHESRQFDLNTQYAAYSDNNNRFEVGGSYYERWYSGPRYKFSTRLNAGYSNNSEGYTPTLRSGLPYFNPKNDATVSLTVDNDYLTYRYYDTTFHQRLALSVGNYWQQGYGSDLIGSIQYEHRWKTLDRFELTYGASRGYTSYDGTPTENWIFYLNTDLRF